MRKKAGVFMTGLLLGALSGGATALFSATYLKHGAGAHRQSTAERLSTQTVKALDRDQEELGTWSGQVIMGKQVSNQALTDAPLGWY